MRIDIMFHRALNPSSPVRELCNAIIVGCAFTLLLNLQSFIAIYNDVFTLEYLGADVQGSADEIFYMAVIHDVADGYFNVGNTSFFEHRNAPSVIGYTSLLQGFIMHFFSLSLETVLLIGDVLFPLLIGCVIYLILSRCEKDTRVVVLGVFAIMAWKGLGWLRVLSPQITGLLFLGTLLTFFYDGTRSHMSRGVLIALLLLTQPVYAAYVLLAEGLLFFIDWKKDGFLHALSIHAPIICAVTGAVFLRFFFSIHTADLVALADTYRRIGLTPTRIFAAPGLQILILLTLVLHRFSVQRLHSFSRLDHVIIPVLFLSSFLVLWQSVFLGVDANFGLYYTFPIHCFLWIVFFRSMSLLLPVSFRVLCSGCIAIFYVLSFSTQVWRSSPSAPTSLSFLTIEHVLSSISDTTSIRIVAAPIAISNFVPVLTPHYTFFTQYAHFQYASDQELAERYLTHNALFPLESNYTVEGDPLVFGLYAGNLSAKKRSWCRILMRLGLSQGPCNQRLVDFIYHQDVREFMENANINIIEMLKKYRVNTMIDRKPLPSAIIRYCVPRVTVEQYTVYDCDFDD